MENATKEKFKEVTDRLPAVPSADFTKGMLSHIKCGIIIVNRNHEILHFSQTAEKIFRYEANEVVGQDLSILMDEIDGPRHLDYVEDYLRRSSVGGPMVSQTNREIIGRTKDGKDVSLFINLEPLNEKVLGIVFSL